MDALRVEMKKLQNEAFVLPEPGKKYHIVSAGPFFEHQGIHKAMTVNNSYLEKPNWLWWDTAADQSEQYFSFEPIENEGDKLYYAMKHEATGLYVSTLCDNNGNLVANAFGLVEGPDIVELETLGYGQLAIKHEGHMLHAGDHNEGFAINTSGMYGGTLGVSSSLVGWAAGANTCSAWYIRELNRLPYAAKNISDLNFKSETINLYEGVDTLVFTADIDCAFENLKIYDLLGEEITMSASKYGATATVVFQDGPIASFYFEMENQEGVGEVTLHGSVQSPVPDQVRKYPFKITTDANHPELYAIQSGRGDTYWWTYDPADGMISLAPYTYSDTQHWYFMELIEGGDVYLMLYPYLGEGKAMGYQNTSSGAAKVVAVTPGEPSYDCRWIFDNNNGSAPYGLKTSDNAIYLSNYGGPQNKMGFWTVGPTGDGGTAMYFEPVNMDYDEILAAVVDEADVLLAAAAGNHVEAPALGQYSTAAYTAFEAAIAEAKAIATATQKDIDTMNEAIKAFHMAKNMPVFTINGVYRYAQDKYIYDNNSNTLYFNKDKDLEDETMLWAFDMTSTEVGVTESVVVRNLATGNLFWNSASLRIVETAEADTADGRFCFYVDHHDYPVHADQTLNTIVSWDTNLAESASAWVFTYVGTTYDLYDLDATAWNDVTADYVKSADLASTEGWVAIGGGYAHKAGERVAEFYAGWGALENTAGSLLQEVVLPAGTYRLTGKAFYRYGGTFDVDASKSLGYMVAGDNKVAVKTLGSVEGLDTYADNMDQASAAFYEQDFYTNVLEFTLTEETTLNLGFECTHDEAKSWLIMGEVKLERTEDLSSALKAEFEAKATEFCQYSNMAMYSLQGVMARWEEKTTTVMSSTDIFSLTFIIL